LSANRKEVDIKKLDIEIQEQQRKISGQVRTGSLLRQLRIERELSLTALGEQLGVSSAYLSNIEQGVKAMSDHFTRQIADFYNVDENTLFGLLGRVPLLAREQLDEAGGLQDLLVEIKRNPKLTEEKKQRLFDQMYELYKNFPE
jgi:transcriptional regulator with XRE-family HTH domain